MQKYILIAAAFFLALPTILYTSRNSMFFGECKDNAGVVQAQITEENEKQSEIFHSPSSSAEVLAWLRAAPWKEKKNLQKPSNDLIQYISTHEDPSLEPIPWISEAKLLYDEKQYIKSAQKIIENISFDRTLLSFQIHHIDAVAFPLACVLLNEKHADITLELLSACAVASAAPIAYLRSLALRLSPEEFHSLWNDEEPYIVLVDFGKPARFSVLADRQDRDSMESSFDVEQFHTGKGSLRIALSESNRDDLLVAGWHEQFMSLDPGEAAIRTWVHEEIPQPLEFVIQVLGTLWDKEPFQWLLRVPEPRKEEDGWLCFDTSFIRKDLMGALFYQYGWNRSFTMHFAEPDALASAKLQIAGLGFDIPPGPANKLWLNRIELYLPHNSWQQKAKAPSPAEFGSFWLTPAPAATQTLDSSTSREDLEALRSMGYLGAVATSHSQNGVLVYDSHKACNGVNFVVSGHGPELTLMDMEGKPIHVWRCNFEDPKWPESEVPASFMHSSFWRRAYLYPNGDVLAILDSIVLVKMDKDGNLIWAKSGGYHHNIDVMEDGTIYVLYAEKQHHPESGYGDEPLVDYIMALDADGQELWRVSLIKALENSFYAPVLHSLNFTHDVLHTNSIKVLDGELVKRIPAFKKGNVLVCMHQASLIAVIDPELKSVVWAQGGQWLYPHEPVVLPGGTMMIFDNLGPQWNYMNRLASRIIEFDPVTREVVWEYTGTRERPFQSYFCGSVAPLPNGNVLISETSGGRAFEVTRDKEIVWEFFNTHRSGKNNELIAVVFEVTRFPEAYVNEWLHLDKNIKATK